MTKINAEEYRILKRLIEPLKKFKQYIARDEDGMLYAYRVKPIKYTNQKWVDGYQKVEVQNDLFHFIQWEDESPYSIAELIEEYEDKEFYDYVGWEYHKSKESEMKDIEWLKREIHKELESWHGVEGGIDGDGINEIMLLINQHEESEVKRLERKIKELDSYNDELIRDNNQFRNELDNQEVLSHEWIDKHSYNVHLLGTPDVTTVAVPREDLQNLLVPKQELPVIPKFVADWIESRKNNYPSDVIGVYLRMNELSANEQTREVLRWVHESKLNRGSFARAWLDGFTVEEEQKYYVKDEKGNILLKKVTKGFGIDDRKGEIVNSSNVGEVSDFRLTEQEIKEYDPRYWAFREPVGELEK